MPWSAEPVGWLSYQMTLVPRSLAWIRHRPPILPGIAMASVISCWIQRGSVFSVGCVGLFPQQGGGSPPAFMVL